tara:strand:- start:15 stop:992 length:978 start_codon:yes stop_codon:yes gene_type:complete
MHKKPGISFLEVMIGMAVSTMLISVTFTIYNHITQTIQRTDQTTAIDTKIMVLQSRLQSDLYGLSPIWFTKQEYDNVKNEKIKIKDQQNQTKQNNNNTKHNSKNFFHSENKPNGNIHYFTFLTVNAMHTYGTDNQHFVRVVYALEQSSTEANIFTLKRKEIKSVTSEIDQSEITAPHNFYDIVTGITKCTATYTYIEHSDNNQKASNDEQKTSDTNQPPKIISLSEWNIQQEAQETKNENKNKQPLTPSFMTLDITFVQNQENDEQEHKINFAIPIDTTNKLSSFAQMIENNKTKKTTTQTQQQSGKQAAPQTAKPTAAKGAKSA